MVSFITPESIFGRIHSTNVCNTTNTFVCWHNYDRFVGANCQFLFVCGLSFKFRDSIPTGSGSGWRLLSCQRARLVFLLPHRRALMASGASSLIERIFLAFFLTFSLAFLLFSTSSTTCTLHQKAPTAIKLINFHFNEFYRWENSPPKMDNSIPTVIQMRVGGRDSRNDEFMAATELLFNFHRKFLFWNCF